MAAIVRHSNVQKTFVRHFLHRTIDQIGNTPLIAIDGYGHKRAEFSAKLEWCNQYGSVKDRIALYMVKRAQERGELDRGKTIIVEATSGNTGIALAGISKAFGYEVEIIIPEKVSEETKRILRDMGIDVQETPDDLCPRVGAGTDQCISLARSMIASNPTRRKQGLKQYYMPNQYENFDNFLAHYETTGPEMWRQTHGEVTHFVCGVGTGGTITGVGQYLKQKDPDVRVIAVEPQKGHHIQGLRNFEESATPRVLEARKDVIDRWIRVSDEEAFGAVKTLAFGEKLFVGPSSGAVMHAALKLSQEEDGRYVLMFGDDGTKYQSLYEEFDVFERQEMEEIVRQHTPTVGS